MAGTSPKIRIQAPSMDLGEDAALLYQLWRSGWERLAPEYVDPLNVLYNDGLISQWTMGWVPKDIAGTRDELILIIWETPDWAKTPMWSVYRNGRQVLSVPDERDHPLAPILHELLDSDDLPRLTFARFCQQLSHSAADVTRQDALMSALKAMLEARPELATTLYDAVICVFQSAVQPGNWPTLDLQKVRVLESFIPTLNLLSVVSHTAELSAGQLQSIRNAINKLDGLRFRVLREIHPLCRPRLAQCEAQLSLPLRQLRDRVSESAAASPFVLFPRE